MTTSLAELHCQPEPPALDTSGIQTLQAEIHDDWVLSEDGKRITREFRFRNYYQTLAFVNAAAWVAHAEDHHPDMTVSYNRCSVCYSTHSAGGLSENDFICAARIDALAVNHA